MFNTKPKLNGAICPNCKGELMDSRPGMMLMSYPPQKDVNCSVCDYVGYLQLGKKAEE